MVFPSRIWRQHHLDYEPCTQHHKRPLCDNNSAAGTVPKSLRRVGSRECDRRHAIRTYDHRTAPIPLCCLFFLWPGVIPFNEIQEGDHHCLRHSQTYRSVLCSAGCRSCPPQKTVFYLIAQRVLISTSGRASPDQSAFRTGTPLKLPLACRTLLVALSYMTSGLR